MGIVNNWHNRGRTGTPLSDIKSADVLWLVLEGAVAGKNIRLIKKIIKYIEELDKTITKKINE